MRKSFWQNLPFLRFLAAFWGWITMILFTADFFLGHVYQNSISVCAIIYGTILAIYVGSKEYDRWAKNHDFQSKYFGEIYVVIWTILMVAFVVLPAFGNDFFKIPAEFPAVYLTVVSIFILSRQSRYFKNK